MGIGFNRSGKTIISMKGWADILAGYALILFLLLAPAVVDASHAGSSGKTFTLTILHVNDTHSHLDPGIISYSCQDRRYRVEVGGYARLAEAVNELRQKGEPLLFLHAGDMVQGTLYYTKYQGRADMDLLNQIGLDAATLGNHDFDGGPDLTAALVGQAAFPIVSANIHVSPVSSLSGRIKPYIIKTFSDEKVAIIGVTTPYTKVLSRSGERVRFGDVPARVAAAIREVQMEGINKIILLTHIGYDEDLRLARTVAGIDVIIGGHSHTLLGGQGGNSGTFRSAGLQLHPAGDYPTVITGPGGQTVLVAQAWEWGKLLGNLRVIFDEKGQVKSWQGSPVIVAADPVPQEQNVNMVDFIQLPQSKDISCLPSVVKSFEENPQIQKNIARYAEPLDAFRHEKVATATRDFKRSELFGPGQLVAESMLWKTRHLGTRAALQNVGGVRCDILAGDITIQTVHELLPFSNTIVVVELTGKQLRRTLEEMIRGYIAEGRSQLIYTAGLTFYINRRVDFGRRVTDLRISGPGGSEPVDPVGLYRVAVQNYLAEGGDGCETLKHADGYRNNTGLLDTDIFVEYLKQFPEALVNFRQPKGK